MPNYSGNVVIKVQKPTLLSYNDTYFGVREIGTFFIGNTTNDGGIVHNPTTDGHPHGYNTDPVWTYGNWRIYATSTPFAFEIAYNDILVQSFQSTLASIPDPNEYALLLPNAPLYYQIDGGAMLRLAVNSDVIHTIDYGLDVTVDLSYDNNKLVATASGGTPPYTFNFNRSGAGARARASQQTTTRTAQNGVVTYTAEMPTPPNGTYSVTATDSTEAESAQQSVVVSAGSGVGDPYITPVYGKMYKIPNRECSYRLFKHDSTVVNGYVSRFDENVINEKCTALNSLHNNFKSTPFDLSSMYYFSKVYISHNGVSDVYNLVTQTFETNAFECSHSTGLVKSCELYSGEKTSVCTLNLGPLCLEMYTVNNPQVISGVSVRAGTSLQSAGGLLVYEQCSKSQRLKSFTSHKDTVKIIKKGTTCKEAFTIKTAHGVTYSERSIPIL